VAARWRRLWGRWVGGLITEPVCPDPSGLLHPVQRGGDGDGNSSEPVRGAVAAGEVASPTILGAGGPRTTGRR
jgi:hypothetical protein